MRNTEEPCILRFGQVSAYDASRHMARVLFMEKGLMTSDWLPVLIHNARANQDFRPLDIDEHVACLMAGNGFETGIIIGAFYDDTNKPEDNDPDIRYTKFSDGTITKYDRKKHLLQVKCVGDIEIYSSQNVTIDSKSPCLINAPTVTISGSSGVSLSSGFGSINFGTGDESVRIRSEDRISIDTEDYMKLSASQEAKLNAENVKISAKNNITLSAPHITLAGKVD